MLDYLVQQYSAFVRHPTVIDATEYLLCQLLARPRFARALRGAFEQAEGPAEKEEGLWTTREAAEALGVALETFRSWVKNHEELRDLAEPLPGGRGDLLWPPEALRNWWDVAASRRRKRRDEG